MNKSVSLNSGTALQDGVNFVRFTVLGKGSPSEAELLAREAQASPRVLEKLAKAATEPGLTTNWPANLTDPVNRAWIDSLVNHGVMDGAMKWVHRVPLNCSASVITLIAAGAAVDEGAHKPVGTLGVGTSGPLMPRKAGAIVVMAPEVWRSSQADSQALVRRSIQAGVARATDEEFLSVVSDGAVDAGSSSGSDVGAVLADLAALLSAVQVGQASKLFIVMSSENAKAIAFMGSDNGFAFKDVTPQGGQIQGVPLLVSDAIPADEIMLIDGSGIAASAGTVVFSSASHATLRMDDDPENSSAQTSLWQRNLLGLRCERWFGCAMIRDNAAAVVDGVDYSNSATA